MPILATRQADSLRLTFRRREEMATFFESARSENGFLLRLDEEPALFREEEIRVVLEGSGDVAFRAQVIQSFPHPDGGFQVALQWLDFERRRAALERLLAPEEEQADESETIGVSPVHRIREMSASEKTQLAMRAGRTERRILARDSTPPVLLSLLNNPRIEDEEVLAVVKSHHATGGIFQRVMGDRRWRGNYPIRLAVATNPKTPQPLALSLIPTLRGHDLRRLAKSQDLREAVRREVLRTVQRQH